MVNRKPVRTRGKLSLSKKFQELEKGQAVAFVFEGSVVSNVLKRMQGRTGKVLGKRGESYLVEVKDGNKKKKYIVDSIHLKKIKQIKTQ